jgi:hypothetical protein
MAMVDRHQKHSAGPCFAKRGPADAFSLSNSCGIARRLLHSAVVTAIVIYYSKNLVCKTIRVALGASF